MLKVLLFLDDEGEATVRYGLVAFEGDAALKDREQRSALRAALGTGATSGLWSDRCIS